MTAMAGSQAALSPPLLPRPAVRVMSNMEQSPVQHSSYSHRCYFIVFALVVTITRCAHSSHMHLQALAHLCSPCCHAVGPRFEEWDIHSLNVCATMSIVRGQCQAGVFDYN